jgi:hypothetical protein
MLKILPEPAATVIETAAWTGLRASELRGLTWDCLTLSTDNESMAFSAVRRSSGATMSANRKPSVQKLQCQLYPSWLRV